jgi:hypothetical protein
VRVLGQLWRALASITMVAVLDLLEEFDPDA